MRWWWIVGVVSEAHMLSERALSALSLTGTATATRRLIAERGSSALVGLAVAENKLMGDLLQARLDEVGGQCLAEGTSYAPSWLGTPELRTGLARLYNDHVLRKERVSAAEVAVTASATAAIDTLLYALCEAGDAVVTPAPCYGSYRRDVEARADCVLIAVPGARRGVLPTVDELDAAAGEARVLLISNPQNPLGVVLDHATLTATVDWARRRRLQVVVDEVFACSVFDGSFESALDIVGEAEDVHVVYSCSKDLCLSGYRVGCVISKNEKLIEAFGVLSAFSSAAVPVQLAVERLLQDKTWLGEIWIPELRRRLEASWTHARALLRERGLAVVGEPSAGHFCLLDLLDGLDVPTSSSAADVDACLNRLLIDQGVVLTPGCPNMGLATPGLFRLCHAGHDAATVADGIGRVARAVETYRASAGIV